MVHIQGCEGPAASLLDVPPPEQSYSISVVILEHRMDFVLLSFWDYSSTKRVDFKFETYPKNLSLNGFAIPGLIISAALMANWSVIPDI